MFNTRSALGLAAACLAASSAVATPTTIDFEPGGVLLNPGETYVERHVQFTPGGSGGALIDLSFCDPSIEFCAVGNNTSYLTGLNDTVVEMRGERMFALEGFEASFVPSPFINFSGSAIRLRIHAVTWDGLGTIDQDLELLEEPGGTGNFIFAAYGLTPSFSGLRSVEFSVCFIGTSGFCERPSGPFLNDAQFALDNISLNVPEPTPAALLAMGLAGLALRRRARG